MELEDKKKALLSMMVQAGGVPEAEALQRINTAYGNISQGDLGNATINPEAAARMGMISREQGAPLEALPVEQALANSREKAQRFQKLKAILQRKPETYPATE